MRNNIFVGPLPPPFGGVAVVNQSVQQLHLDGFHSVAFNTSRGSEREDLYGAKRFANLWHQLSLAWLLFKTLRSSNFDLGNVFVTSGKAILRDIVLISILRLFKVNVIIHFHSKEKGEFALTPFRLWLFGTILSKLANSTIFLSNKHKDYFSSHFPYCRHEVLENFVFTDDFYSDKTQHNKTARLLFVGRLSREKGFFDLLVALGQMSEFPFILDCLGQPVDDASEQQIVDLIEEMNLTDKVKLHGSVTGAKKFRHFQQADCLVFPSHFENSPVVLKEAIASSLYIISSDIKANRDIIHSLPFIDFFEVENKLNLQTKIENYLSKFYSQKFSVVRDPRILYQISNRKAQKEFNQIVNSTVS